MRRFRKLLPAIFILYLSACIVAGIVVSEGSLHLRRLALRHQQEFSDQVLQSYQAKLEYVSITTEDSLLLMGWYAHPLNSNGNAVILLHGITDNREGVFGYARMFLDQGYSVLLPDARAHGESGGDVATYGLKESGDIHQWVSWLYANDRPQCVYGFGESYGAALMLQSLAAEKRYCAVVVEDAFSTAREMSYERVSGPFHVGSWFGRTLGLPVILAAQSYGEWKYDVDLLRPSPLQALIRSSVPVLLIHGMEDHTINPRHSELLAQAAPSHVQLWLVPHAHHTGAWSAAPEEFQSRVLNWFKQHHAQITP
ncbi:MAG TPA: alpha/beta fold hydrolase [Candidatus Angelobacter sp.]|nr:alpha/beta fold hydrolase [Candidatus Angelobacter sp.]